MNLYILYRDLRHDKCSFGSLGVKSVKMSLDIITIVFDDGCIGLRELCFSYSFIIVFSLE